MLSLILCICLNFELFGAKTEGIVLDMPAAAMHPNKLEQQRCCSAKEDWQNSSTV